MTDNRWVREFKASIMVCDTQGIILDMNEAAENAYASDGGRALIGSNVLGCHPEPARAQLMGRFDKDDTEHFGLIPRQDMGNIERQQRGFHSLAYRESRLSTEWERAITNMHEELDRYLAR